MGFSWANDVFWATCLKMIIKLYSKKLKFEFRNTNLKIIWDTLDSENRTYSWSILITVYNMFWVRKRNVKETFLLCTQNFWWIDKRTMTIIIFRGDKFLCLPLWFEMLIIWNKTSCPEDFEFTRFNCTVASVFKVFVNFPVSKKNRPSPWQPCLLKDQHLFEHLSRGSTKNPFMPNYFQIGLVVGFLKKKKKKKIFLSPCHSNQKFYMLFWFGLIKSQSTAMVMLRLSVHLTTLFPGLTWLSSKPVLCAHTFACYRQQPFLNQEEYDRRNYRKTEFSHFCLKTRINIRGF